MVTYLFISMRWVILKDKHQMRDVFAAIADPTRRMLLRLMAEVEDVPLHQLTVQFRIGRTAISKHLTILKAADLVTSQKVGRETRYRLNAAPLKEIQDWVSFYEKFWRERHDKLKLILEEGKKMKSDVSLDFQFTSSIEQVWNALTDSKTLAKWVMDNDFKLIVGHKFQFRTEPSEWWDGIVNCEVLKVDKPHKLAYTWASGSENTTVTLTLTKANDETTHLHLEQTGFSEKKAIEGSKYGWMRMCDQLEKVLAEL